MKASQLLEFVREDYLMDQAGTGNAQRWSDASLLRRLNQAHREAVSRGLLIRDDSTARVCEITLVGGQADYLLDPRIIKVESISLIWTDDTLKPLSALTAGQLGSLLGPQWQTLEGLPSAYYPEGHRIRLAFVPAAEYAGMKLRVDVRRYPLAKLVAWYSGKVTVAASAGDTSVTVSTVENLPTVGAGEEIHLTGAGGTIVCTGREGNVLTCLPLAAAWDVGTAIYGDSEPEIPAAMHEALLFYVIAHAYLKEDPDVKGSVGYYETYMKKFADAFGPMIDHSQRMHRLQSSDSMRFTGIQYPNFRKPVAARAWVV